MKQKKFFTFENAILLLLLFFLIGFATGCLRQDPMEARVDSLVEELGNEDTNISSAALNALIDIGEPAVPSLIPALTAKEAPVRERSALILGRIEDKRAVEALSKTLSDPDPKVRGAAVNALCNIETNETTKLLIPLLQDEDE
ncbi:MAG: HEAT repeat domain-containing protein, partial [Methanosarcinaceae archaeon]|nr:HEAT repeat domain-containing protein [Methanosarcinaceae archaeon]